MIVVLVLIVVVVIGLILAAVTGRIGGSMSEPARSQAMLDLPDRALRQDDIAQLRFDQALRGYRMDQVDRVIDRLTDEVVEQQRHIRALEDSAEGRSPALDPPDRPSQDGAG